MTEEIRSPSAVDSPQSALLTTGDAAAVAPPPMQAHVSELWKRHVPRLLTFAQKEISRRPWRRQTHGSPAGGLTADDVVQIVFFQIISGAKRCEEGADAVRFVLRLIREYVEHQSRLKENRTPHVAVSTWSDEEQENEVVDESRFLNPRHQLTPEDLVIGREEMKNLLPLIPARCRRMVRLRVLRDGLTAKELAMELGVTEDDVWNLVKVARRHVGRRR
jgi:RNA polymerase sigma factor (sigma-70 family)